MKKFNNLKKKKKRCADSQQQHQKHFYHHHQLQSVSVSHHLRYQILRYTVVYEPQVYVTEPYTISFAIQNQMLRASRCKLKLHNLALHT